MKFIQLTKGKRAIVDDEDFEFLNQFKWCYHLGYAIRYAGGGRKNRRFERMHRVVNNTPDELFTDHINGDKLDNRKSNLRTVDHRANSINRKIQPNNTSGVRGVYFVKSCPGWLASIQVRGKQIHIGYFKNFQDAVNARHKAEKKYFHDVESPFI